MKNKDIPLLGGKAQQVCRFFSQLSPKMFILDAGRAFSGSSALWFFSFLRMLGLSWPRPNLTEKLAPVSSLLGWRREDSILQTRIACMTMDESTQYVFCSSTHTYVWCHHNTAFDLPVKFSLFLFPVLSFVSPSRGIWQEPSAQSETKTQKNKFCFCTVV